MLKWCLSANGRYITKSLYQVMATSGLIGWQFTSIWTYLVLPSIKVFLFLFLWDKLMIREVMIKMRFNCQLECPLCETGEMESAMHLFFECEFAKLVWGGVCNYLGCHSIQSLSRYNISRAKNATGTGVMRRQRRDGGYIS